MMSTWTHRSLFADEVNRVTIGSGYGLPPIKSQAISGMNVDLLIKHLGTDFGEIEI